MEVSTEAKRIMVVALGKLYSSRTQRGGLRLHRSLLLSLVMKSARDLYHAAQAAPPPPPPPPPPPAPTETRTLPGEEISVEPDKENQGPTPAALHSRKRRGKAAVVPDFLPCKKAKLEQLGVHPVLVDYMQCAGDLGAAPLPVHRAIAAC